MDVGKKRPGRIGFANVEVGDAGGMNDNVGPRPPDDASDLFGARNVSFGAGKRENRVPLGEHLGESMPK